MSSSPSTIAPAAASRRQRPGTEDSLKPTHAYPVVVASTKVGGDDGDTLLERAPKIAKAPRYMVVFWNDPYTTKWFVSHVLQTFFKMSEASAITLMMAIHRKGKGVAGVYTRDIAETKAMEVMEYAKEFEMPLKVTAEPEETGDGSDE